MSIQTKLITLITIAVVALSCSSDKSSSDKLREKYNVKKEPTSLAEAEANWKDYKGVGPITSITIPVEIDAELAATGQEIFEAKCTACHKTEKRFIGPSPKGIMERRNPEWVMNMILNPDEMVQKDLLAKQLLIEFNGSPMANQNLKEEEARAVLEYFRTL
ncbi:MAG: cytochrome c [Reichenbachiella sp.]